ncbi:helix-turn-helix domain-containing protein [Kitasatospora sp. NPDC006697]|uniref:helix-turn-helix domain-containing protein n=1 Tax=Kitasatospora sp. NPDC006697 TaxID=3364020 RepID=UPI0036CDCA70
MTTRVVLTERQKRVGSELRKIRTAAGMSAETAAGLLGVDRAKISNMESGQRSISPERLRTLALNCDCSDEKYVEALVEMVTPGAKGWWEKYRGTLSQGMLDIAELEAHATRLRTTDTVHIPGLLQTADHAIAVFRAVLPSLPEHEVGLRLAHRAERQQIVQAGATEYVAILHEAALRMQFGGRKSARTQLEHLAAISERENITLIVIPFDHGAFPGAGQTALYAEGPVPQLDTVQVDRAHGPEFLSAESQLAKYRAQLDRLEELALSPGQSRDLIREIAHQL